MTATMYRLETGWVHIRFSGGFAQLPPGFDGETLPDEYIFQPEWNRDRVNKWWKATKGELTCRSK